MKKLCSFFLVTILLFSGCQSSAKEEAKVSTGHRLKVLSTIAMVGDVVAQIGGDRIEHSVLITGEIDPHSYELVKGDDEKIEGATIVFLSGLNLEHGASLRYKILNHAHPVSLGDLVLMKHPELILFENGQADPHIWMDVSLWTHIIDPIVEALSSEDPEGREYYETAGKALKEKMLLFHCALKDKLQAVPETKRYLVTSHDAFGYFARGYLSSEDEQRENLWKKRVAAPEGLAPDGQLSVMHLQEIIDHLIGYQIEVVFPESNVSRDALRKIVSACKEKKASIRFSSDVLYGDCMGVTGSLGGTYLGMLEHNGLVLLKEWQ